MDSKKINKMSGKVWVYPSGATLQLKPLSVNECWQGRRFKTDKYLAYEIAALLMLPQIKLPPPPYEIYLTFGVSNSLSDWDNPVKPFQDILQKKYGFNDREVLRATVEKVLVKKGAEYIHFNIYTYIKVPRG